MYYSHLNESTKIDYCVIGDDRLSFTHNVQLPGFDDSLIEFSPCNGGGKLAHTLSSKRFFLIYYNPFTETLNQFDKKTLALVSLLRCLHHNIVVITWLLHHLFPLWGLVLGAADIVPEFNWKSTPQTNHRANAKFACYFATLQSGRNAFSLLILATVYTQYRTSPALDGTNVLSLNEMKTCEFCSAHKCDARLKPAPASISFVSRSTVAQLQTFFSLKSFCFKLQFML